jgi:hypothetical protein
MPDGTPWVCGNCRSVNPDRSSRCYSCRTPRALALDPKAISSAPPIARDAAPEVQAQIAAETGAQYRSSAPFALIVRVTIILISALTLFRLVELAIVEDPSKFTTFEDLDARLAGVDLVEYAWLGAWFVASILWGLWLSRVIGNVPALGGGWTSATPRSAFFESIVPVFNLYWSVSILREAYTRLSAPREPSLGTLTAWWLSLAIAALLLIRIGPLYILRQIVTTVVLVIVGLVAGTRGMIVSIFLVEAFGSFLILAAAFLAIRIVDAIEDLQRERRQQLAAVSPAVSR